MCGANDLEAVRETDADGLPLVDDDLRHGVALEERGAGFARGGLDRTAHGAHAAAHEAPRPGDPYSSPPRPWYVITHAVPGSRTHRPRPDDALRRERTLDRRVLEEVLDGLGGTSRDGELVDRVLAFAVQIPLDVHPLRSNT